MRRLALILAAGAAISLTACGLGTPDYPQFTQSAYRIEGTTTPASGAAPTRTVIYRDGPKMRVEATLAEYGQAIVVFDESTRGAYVLNPTGQLPTVQPAQPAAQPPANGQPAAPPAAGQTAAAPVVGVASRIRDAEAPQPLETPWAALGSDNARYVGRCEVAGEQGHAWRPREAPAPGVERVACITDDGIVLRVTEDGRALWEATSLQRGE